jgi:four helix bundle protein
MLNTFVAFQVAKDFYQNGKRLKLSPHLKDQFMRASSSIALNLAEGSGKRTANEKKHFYATALGSLRECQAILAIESVEDQNLNELSNRLGAMLFTLSGKRSTHLERRTTNDERRTD